MTAFETPVNRLVHINLAVRMQAQQVASILMRERPFIGELNLDIDPDNLSLLIAVGEVMDVAQPLTVSRISCMEHLAILQTCNDDTGEHCLRQLGEEGIQILLPSDQREYDILVRNHCAARLWQWMR